MKEDTKIMAYKDDKKLEEKTGIKWKKEET